jgi:hypothetical protein
VAVADQGLPPKFRRPRSVLRLLECSPFVMKDHLLHLLVQEFGNLLLSSQNTLSVLAAARRIIAEAPGLSPGGRSCGVHCFVEFEIASSSPVSSLPFSWPLRATPAGFSRSSAQARLHFRTPARTGFTVSGPKWSAASAPFFP